MKHFASIDLTIALGYNFCAFSFLSVTRQATIRLFCTFYFFSLSTRCHISYNSTNGANAKVLKPPTPNGRQYGPFSLGQMVDSNDPSPTPSPPPRPPPSSPKRKGHGDTGGVVTDSNDPKPTPSPPPRPPPSSPRRKGHGDTRGVATDSNDPKPTPSPPPRPPPSSPRRKDHYTTPSVIASLLNHPGSIDSGVSTMTSSATTFALPAHELIFSPPHQDPSPSPPPRPPPPSPKRKSHDLTANAINKLVHLAMVTSPQLW